MTDAEQTELAALRREVAAWRALAEHLSSDGTRGAFPYLNIQGRWFAYASNPDNTYGLDVVADTPQSAAIALAEQLGILPKGEA
jgi:hypothetical protein